MGLDYFPISTDFIHDRIVRRIMKSEGDAAVTVLVETLCSIYTNEGYYALADALFYEDLADNLYEKDAAYVQRVITLASEYGLFNSTLFREYGLLTSADIQRGGEHSPRTDNPRSHPGDIPSPALHWASAHHRHKGSELGAAGGKLRNCCPHPQAARAWDYVFRSSGVSWALLATSSASRERARRPGRAGAPAQVGSSGQGSGLQA